MTRVLDDTLFDDPQRLAAADGGESLRQAALAGAQVRSVWEVASEVGLDELAEQRPRALVLVARPGVAPAAFRALAALVAPTAPFPVVLADVVPPWVGPLDVVVAHTDDEGDSALAESVAAATRRGAGVVLTAGPDGPVAAAGAGRARLLSPRVPVPAALSFGHVFAVGARVLVELGLLSCDGDGIADELDAEAARSRPDNEPATNPAKSLALRLADRSPLLWGLDPVSTAAGEHGAFALAAHAGVVCDVAELAQAATRPALHRAATTEDSGRDLFADPEDQPVALRVFLLSARHDARAEAGERAAAEALPGADLLTPGEAVREDAAARSALLALRFDLAAVYLGLAAGTANGPQALALR